MNRERERDEEEEEKEEESGEEDDTTVIQSHQNFNVNFKSAVIIVKSFGKAI